MAEPVPRHSFYENEEELFLDVFIKGLERTKVSVNFEPRKLTLQYLDQKWTLDSLKGFIDPEGSSFEVRPVKIAITLKKQGLGRWGTLEAKADPLASTYTAPIQPQVQPQAGPGGSTSHTPTFKKNWDKLATESLDSLGKEKSITDDPNAGGDVALNSFFQQIYKDADDDAKKAMLKSYTESGGTTLSTNWDDVKKGTVPNKPPEGQSFKK